LPAYRTSCAEYSPAASQTSTPHTVFLAQIASDVQAAAREDGWKRTINGMVHSPADAASARIAPHHVRWQAVFPLVSV
jgi:hypothetical protein